MNRFTRCSIIIQIKLNLYNIVPQRILLLQLWELLYTNYRLSLRLYENLNQILCSYNWKHWIKISFCCIFTSTIRLSFSIQNLQRTRETCMKSWGSTLGKFASQMCLLFATWESVYLPLIDWCPKPSGLVPSHSALKLNDTKHCPKEFPIFFMDPYHQDHF